MKQASDIINLTAYQSLSAFKQNIFPNIAKVACVRPLDKKTENKHSISNFRPVSILNTFSKIYEKFSKDFLISEIAIFLSLFFSSIQKIVQYSTCPRKNDRIVKGKFR